MTFKEKVLFGKRVLNAGMSLRVHGEDGPEAAKQIVEDTGAIVLNDIMPLVRSGYATQVVFVGDQRVHSVINNKFVHIT